jgi:7,8-dihydropterin-6-yl-methyl-4-(beta-D-ribofuranosyl)aminobenzene 5'-phosphate synthase
MSKPKITCIVDNAVQPGSRLWGEHGVSFLVETEGRCVLFDAGQSGAVLLHNMAALGVDPATIDALAISHAHYDHTGGLPALLECTRPGLPLYANPDLFRERFVRRRERIESIGLLLAREDSWRNASGRQLMHARSRLSTSRNRRRPDGERICVRHPSAWDSGKARARSRL